MRARDNGLPSYLVLRDRYGLEPRTWESINPELNAKNPQVNLNTP